MKFKFVTLIATVSIVSVVTSCDNNPLKVDRKGGITYNVGSFFKSEDYNVSYEGKTLNSDEYEVYVDNEIFPDGTVFSSKGNYNLVFKYNDNKTTYMVEVGSKAPTTTTIEDFKYYDLAMNDSIPAINSIGEQKMLVIPVTIKGFETNATTTNLNRIKKGFAGDSDETNYESVKSFYNKSSYNKLNFDVTVADEWFNLGLTPEEIYRNRTSRDDDGIYFVLDEAIAWYKDKYNTNLEDYDTNKDGLIDAVFLVYSAPYYTKYSGYNSNIQGTYWAFSYWDYMNYQKANIKSPLGFNYTWASYDFLDKGYGISGIDAHTYIHECGHLFGLLDYYDTGYNSKPMGAIDMMDYNVGDHNAMTKFSLGWTKPTIIKGSQTVTLKPFENNGDFLLISSDNYNGGAFDEYFTVEYITPTGLNEKDYKNKYNGTNPVQGYSKPGIRVLHCDNRGATTLSSNKKESTNDPTKINVNYVENSTVTGHASYYNMNNMYEVTIMNKNFDSTDPTNYNPTKSGYEKSDEALYFAGESFDLSSADMTYLMPSKSTKLNKYKLSNDPKDELNFKFTVDSLNDTEATLTFTF